MMDRRYLLNLVASLLVPALLAVATEGARADDGGGPPSGPPPHGDGNGGDNGNHNGWPDAPSNDTPSSEAESADQATTGTTSSSFGDHEAARRAVLDKAAIPLTEMMAIFKKSISGELVDVSLIHGDAALRYRFKYIDDQGHVKRAFFDALSGRQL